VAEVENEKRDGLEQGPVDTGGPNQVDTSAERLQAAWDELDAKKQARPDAGGAGPADDGGASGATAVASILAVVGGIAANVLAPAWKLTQDEIAKLAEAWGAVVANWLPATWLAQLGGGSGASLELEAVGVTIQIFMPRMGTPRFESPPPAGTDTSEPPGQSVPQGPGNIGKPQPGAWADVHGQT